MKSYSLTTARPPDRHDASTNTSTLLREYVWLDGEAVGVLESELFFFVRTNHIGRPVFDADTVQWTASYKPFGPAQTSTGDPIELRFPWAMVPIRERLAPKPDT